MKMETVSMTDNKSDLDRTLADILKERNPEVISRSKATDTVNCGSSTFIKKEPDVIKVNACVKEELSVADSYEIKSEIVDHDPVVEDIPKEETLSLITSLADHGSQSHCLFYHPDFCQTVERVNHVKPSHKEESHKIRQSCAIDQDLSALSSQQHVNITSLVNAPVMGVSGREACDSFFETECLNLNSSNTSSSWDQSEGLERNSASYGLSVTSVDGLESVKQKFIHRKQNVTGNICDGHVSLFNEHHIVLDRASSPQTFEEIYSESSYHFLQPENCDKIEESAKYEKQDKTTEFDPGATSCKSKTTDSSVICETFHNDTNQRQQKRIVSKPPTGEGDFKCRVCSMRFQNMTSLYKHKIVHAPVKLFKFGVCRKMFKWKDDVLKHKTIDSDLKLFKCGVCNRAFKDKYKLHIHKIVHRVLRLFTCEACGRTFKEKRTLNEHKELHLKVSSNKCQVCDKTFKCKQDLQQHKSVHSLVGAFEGKAFHKSHKDIATLGQRRCRFKLKPFKCEVFPEPIRSSDRLKKHNMLHSEMRAMPFKCEVCNETFKSPSHLLEHKAVHSEQSLLQCDVCKKKFKKIIYLLNHKLVHSALRPFKCAVCCKSYKTSTQLLEHRAVHTGQKPFKCNECDKTFKLPYALHSHQAVHSEVRPFKCKICLKAFKRKNSLRKHITVHSGARPFVCEVCGMTFRLRHNLVEHRFVHLEGKHFKCEGCDKTYKSRAGLYNHKKHSCQKGTNILPLFEQNASNLEK